MRIDGEDVFDRVAPYIQNYQAVRAIVARVSGLEPGEAVAVIQEEQRKASGTLATDLRIVLDQMC